MVIKFTVGSKCAVMLPRKMFNPQMTPAKGLIVNKLVDSRSLVLIEEVWQFKGLKQAPLTAMVTSYGALRHKDWGWQELPNLLGSTEEYLIVPAEYSNLMEDKVDTLEAMIKKSVADFKRINDLV